MGAWGHGIFDNDTACDWAYQLEDCDDLSVIQESLNQVIDAGNDYLESDAASEALAACELIARLRGHYGIRNAYTETVDNWVDAHPDLQSDAELDALVKTAHSVIDRILGEDSELVELWNDSDALDEWQAVIEDLRSRLK